MPFTLTTSLIVLTSLASAAAQDEQKQDKPTSQKSETSLPRARIETSMGSIVVELFSNEAPKTVANFLDLAEARREFEDPDTRKKVKRNYYDGLTFHRVIPNFMIQGGCPLGTGSGSPGYTFEDEINAKALGLDQIKAVTDGRPHQNLLIRSQQDFNRVVMQPLFKQMGIASQADLDKRRDEIGPAVEKLTLMDVYANQGYQYDDSRPAHGMKRGTLAMANSGPNTNGSQFFINLVDNDYLTGKHTVFGQVVEGMDIVDKIGTTKTGANDKPATEVTIKSVREVKSN